MSENKPYEAVVMCTVFDENYNFEDNQLVGIAHSPMEARSLLMSDIERVMEDFGDGKAEISNGRSEYDEPITIVHARNNGIERFWNYYCLFKEPDKAVSQEREE